MMVMPFRELYGANEVVIRFIPFSDALELQNSTCSFFYLNVVQERFGKFVNYAASYNLIGAHG